MNRETILVTSSSPESLCLCILVLLSQRLFSVNGHDHKHCTDPGWGCVDFLPEARDPGLVPLHLSSSCPTESPSLCRVRTGRRWHPAAYVFPNQSGSASPAPEMGGGGRSQ